MRQSDTYADRDELDRFKTSVDLVAVALALGYREDASDQSRGITILRRDGAKLAVGQRSGSWCYRNLHDPDDRGSVIDLLQSRLRLSLGHVRQWLREWSHTSRPEQTTSLRSSPDHQPDRKKVAAVWHDAATWDGEHHYLQSRGLNESLMADCFFDTFRKDKKGNAVFPLFDDTGLCGYEYRNHELKRMGKDSIRGLWRSNNLNQVNTIVVCESPIDCMSHYDLYQWQHVGYVSIGGTLTSLQLHLLADWFNKSNHLSVIVGTDNDESGNTYFNQLQSIALFKLKRHTPIGKDWNDDLRYCLRENQ